MKYDRKENLFDIPPRKSAQLDRAQGELEKFVSETDQEEVAKLKEVMAAALALTQLLSDINSSGTSVTLELRVAHSECTPNGDVIYEGEAHLSLIHVLNALTRWKEDELFTPNSYLEIL